MKVKLTWFCWSKQNNHGVWWLYIGDLGYGAQFKKDAEIIAEVNIRHKDGKYRYALIGDKYSRYEECNDRKEYGHNIFLEYCRVNGLTVPEITYGN